MLLIVLAARAARRARPPVGRGSGAPTGPTTAGCAAVVAVGLVAFAVLFAAMPSSPDPIGVPANLVWQFRLNSLSGNLLCGRC